MSLMPNKIPLARLYRKTAAKSGNASADAIADDEVNDLWPAG